MSTLRPKFRTWRKAFERFENGVTHRKHVVRFGHFGIKAIEPFPNNHYMKFTSAQIEAVRRGLTKKLRPEGGGAKNVKLWTLVFPHNPVTRLGQEARMGKGKGEVDHFAAAVRPGQILFEFSNTQKSTVASAFKYAADRIPFRVKLVERKRPSFAAAGMSLADLRDWGAVKWSDREASAEEAGVSQKRPSVVQAVAPPKGRKDLPHSFYMHSLSRPSCRNQ